MSDCLGFHRLRRGPCAILSFVLLYLSAAAIAIRNPGVNGQSVPGAEAAGDQVTIRYELTPVTGPQPMLNFDMRFHVLDAGGRVILQMPAWSPGDYHLQNHARYVRALSARSLEIMNDPGRSLPINQTDRNTWEIKAGNSKEIDVHYTMLASPPGLFSDNIRLRRNQMFINGPSAYLYIMGRKQAPISMVVRTPRSWTVETPLDSVPHIAGSDENVVEFSAPDYDTFADSPIVLADHTAIKLRSFAVNSVPHRILFFGDPVTNSFADSYVPVVKRIVATETALMQSIPYKSYLFLIDVGGTPGGLEHLNSCRIGLPTEASPEQASPFIAHEFFHLWNVKRIRPEVLGPFDYVHTPHTRNLWFAEGVTEYYAHLAGCRAGLSSQKDYLKHLRTAIEDFNHNPAHLEVTADDASYNVWDDGTSTGSGGLSYYQKGELIGLCLDLAIRHASAGVRSLDDVMRLLMLRHAPPRPGYGEDELKTIVNEIAQTDLSPLYDQMARSKEEMPLQECLMYAGLDGSARPLRESTPEQDRLRADWLRTIPQQRF